MKKTNPKAKASSSTAADVVSLSVLCAELKLDPRIAREKLRLAVRDAGKYPALVAARTPRTPWQWTPGSEAERQARDALMEDSPTPNQPSEAT